MVKEPMLEPTESNPVEVESYPYGRLRTRARWWIETKDRRGQRVVFQTLNPKTQQWNNPKKSTYNDVAVLYRNTDNDHIESSGLSFAYDDENCLNKFLATFEGMLTEWQQKQIKIFRAIIKTREFVKMEVKPAPATEEDKQKHDKEQAEIKNKLNGIFAYHCKQEGV